MSQVDLLLRQLLQELSDLCPHPPVSPPEKQCQYILSTVPLASCFDPSFLSHLSNDWMLKSMATMFLQAHLPFLLVNVWTGRQLSSWVILLTFTSSMTLHPKKKKNVALCKLPVNRFFHYHNLPEYVLSRAMCPLWTDSKPAKPLGAGSECEALRDWLYKSRSCGVFCWR